MARSFASSVDIRAGPLDQALQDLARQTGVELLFDRGATAGLQVEAIRARQTPEVILGQLLRDTGLTVRRASSGAFIVERPAAEPLSRQDITVPELLVIGRRTQNADIRRLETDIQPYRVATGLQIVEAQRDNLDQYFRSRVPANTDAVAPRLDVNGETNSQIDMRGLGSNGTLVLIDGRRMPAIPAAIFGFRQSDINAIPLHAIERVETLTGTAGGIHGFGALGGVVNVVLARERRGVELHATGGVTSRGDGGQFTLEGRAAFTLPGGRTEVSLYGGGMRSRPLLNGRRSYLSEDLRIASGLAPQLMVSLIPNGDSVFISNIIYGPSLTLKPEYGGATLGAYYTYLPAGLSGAPAEVTAALVRNAGRFDDSLSMGDAASGIGSNPRSGTLLANVRHRFGGGVEAYLDAVLLWNRGRFASYKSHRRTSLQASARLNPFQQTVQFTFPVANARLERETRFETSRYTGGLAATLPLGWRATGEIALGSARYDYSQSAVDYTGPPFNAPDLNPFASWAEFQAILATYTVSTSTSQAISNRFRDLSLRLAGPVWRTAAGPSTLTLLAERRIENVPGYASVTTNGASRTSSAIASRRGATNSLYAELRAPLFGQAAPAFFLRGLEVQLALRHDAERDDFARDPRAPDTTERLRARFNATVYTAGGKVSPVSWLTLRGSYATGQTPPPLANLIENRFMTVSRPADDLKRGGRAFPGNPAFLYLSGGSAELKTIQASTASFGGMLSPFGEDGPRLTVDYSRVRKTRDVFIPSDQQVIANEDLWPERITRAPLTDADRARGYTGGVITMFDSRPENSGGLKVDTLDARLDWLAQLLGGRLRLYGDGTYYIRQVQTAPFQKDLEIDGYLGRPLKRRGNLGADWSRGTVSLGANLQYFGSYRIYPPAQQAFSINQAVLLQGGERVPGQAYLDIRAGWRRRLRLAGTSQDVKIDFGVVNVLDKAPPRESSFSLQQFSGVAITSGPPGYSRYGDPRRRRFQLIVSTSF